MASRATGSSASSVRAGRRVRRPDPTSRDGHDATADIDNVRFYQRCGFRAASIEQDALEAKGYPAGLEADGIPIRDSITFRLAIGANDAVSRARSVDEQESLSCVREHRRLRHLRRDAFMVTKGIIVRLKARSGQEETVAGFLRDALPLVEQEPQTTSWFALRIDAASFAIVDVFPDEAGRRAHLDGAVAAALAQRGPELLAEPPLIETVDVIAAKLP